LVDGRSPDSEQYLWPENVEAWRVWCALQTQWRVGANGATGLDYSAVCAYMTEVGIVGELRRDVFAGVRAAERSTLDVWNERRQQGG
jgi:hypothetical protein